MNWIKKGLVFCPDGKYEWNHSHAQVPVIDLVNDDIWRIYYTCRDLNQRSRISFIEVEAGCPKNILYVHNQPVINIGEPGDFDDCGAMCASLVEYKQKKIMFYVGWNVRNTISYHNSLGIAVSTDGGRTFFKPYAGPIMDRSINDPYMCTSCDVIVEGDQWKAWYTSGTKWEKVNNVLEPYYNIKCAESSDGIVWNKMGKTAIDYHHAQEAVACPSVIFEQGKYRMWYSYRNTSKYRTDVGNSYRIGYAESKDGIDWMRMDEIVGIDVSSGNAWDSQMIAYSRVFRYKDQLYMFYNGNGFGKTGFGYAICEENTLLREDKYEG